MQPKFCLVEVWCKTRHQNEIFFSWSSLKKDTFNKYQLYFSIDEYYIFFKIIMKNVKTKIDVLYSWNLLLNLIMYRYIY